MLISIRVILENVVLAALLKFPERTGSRFWEPNFCVLSMPFIMIICGWNFENMYISFKVIQVNVVFGGHFKISRAYRKYILRTKIFHMCMLSISIICRWNLENMFITSRAFKKNVVLAAILNFPERTGSRFWEPKMFTCACHLSWTYAVRILKICPIVLELFKKKLFLAAILNFSDQTGSRCEKL